MSEFAFKTKDPHENAGRGRRPEPMTLKTKTAAASARASVLFFGLFAIVGAVVSYFLLVRPTIQIIDARDWNSVPCTILSSRVQSQRGDDGTTYRVDILYAYEVNGREFKANRYHFVGGSSSGYDGKAKVVAQHPPGAKRICYVNPRDPSDAVLHRGFSPVMWFGGIPLLFFAIGVGGMMGLFGKKNAITPEPGAQGPATLKPTASPMAKFLGGLIFSLFWNGIVSVFVVQAYGMWSKGKGGGDKWFLTLFLIPFVLIGIGMVFFTIHSFFGLFSPRVWLRMNQASVGLGETAELSWEFGGRVDKIRDLHLQLEGREERDEGSGKNRRTHKDVFYTADIAHFTSTNDIQSGTVLCPIPLEHPASDAEGAQRVVWQIRLKAKVEFGADLSDEYPVQVIARGRRDTDDHGISHAQNS